MEILLRLIRKGGRPSFKALNLDHLPLFLAAHQGPGIDNTEGVEILGRNGDSRSTMKKAECKGDHQGHLCVLASNDQFDKIKELTQNPQYICFNCGRVAECDDNLCNPMSLKD